MNQFELSRLTGGCGNGPERTSQWARTGTTPRLMRFCAAAFVILLCMTAAAHECCALDTWTSSDKSLHLAAGFAIGSSITLLTNSPGWGMVAGATAGFGKEYLDSQTVSNTFSVKDLTVTAVGALAGAYSGHIVLGPRSILFRTEW